VVLDLSDAYRLVSEADNLVGEGRHGEAAERYTRAAALAPGNHELVFWAGIAAAEGGDMARAVALVREAIGMQPGWADLLERLQPDIAPSAAAVRAALRDSG
jgi:Flp pilus assembly protein TadD